MANLMIAYPNLADPSVLYTPVLSGGSWNANLPLANLQDRRLAKVARSTDAATGSTQFQVDLIIERGVRLVALPTHNFTSAATVEVNGGTTPGGTDVYNGTALAAWPAGHNAESTEGLNVGYVLILPSNLHARYWTILINDTTNPAGYVELGRVFLGLCYFPAINARYGLRLGWEDDSTHTNSDGGATIHNERRVRRWATFTMPEAAVDETMFALWPLFYRQRTTRQVYFVFDSADTTHLFNRSFLARLRDQSALEMATFDRYEIPLSLVEEL